MKAGKLAVDANREQIDIDEVQELQNDIADQMADADEIGDVFANAAQEGNEELEDELADMMGEMEAEEAAKGFGDVIVPGGSIAAAAG